MGGSIGDTWPGRGVAQADNVTTCISLGYESTANRFVVRNGHFGSTARLWMYGLFLFYFIFCCFESSFLPHGLCISL